jgi:hypothetical protein
MHGGGGDAGAAAGDGEPNVEASHQALSIVRPCDNALPRRELFEITSLLQVAGWLGISAEEALEETGAAADELFDTPRPNL